MSKEAMNLALEALKSCDAAHITDGGRQWYDEKLVDKAVEAIEKALADQPAQGCDYCTHPQYAGTKCKNCGREQPAQQEPLTIPDDVVEAAQLMQDGDYRGPLFLARKVFDWVAAHGITKGGAA